MASNGRNYISLGFADFLAGCADFFAGCADLLADFRLALGQTVNASGKVAIAVEPSADNE